MGALLDTFRMTTLAPGWVELPAAYVEGLLAKGKTHKYIKRVPKSGGGYRYFYHVGHGGGVHAADHFVEGAAFRHGDGHYHVTKVDGDRVTVKHDESGHTQTFSKAELGKTLREHHSAALQAHHEKATARLAEAKANKASPKQIAKLEKQVEIGGGTHSGPYVVGVGHDAPPEGAGPDNPDNPWFQGDDEKWHDEKVVKAQQDRAHAAHKKVAKEMDLASKDPAKSEGRRIAEANIANQFLYEHNDGDRQRFIDRFSDPANQHKGNPYDRVKPEVLTREDVTEMIDSARARVGEEANAPYVNKRLYDLAGKAGLGRYWAEQKRKQEELKPHLAELRAMQADAVAPISDAAAAAVDPKKELAALLGYTSAALATKPVSFSSSKNTRVRAEWPARSGVPFMVYDDGKVVAGITSGVKRTIYHENAPPMVTGSIRAPKTPEEYAMVAQDVVSDAKSRLDHSNRTAHEYGDYGVANVDNAKKVALAQKAMTALVAHSIVSSGRSQEAKPAPSTAPATAKAAVTPPASKTAASSGLTSQHHSRAAQLGLTLSASGNTVHVGGAGTYGHKDTRIKPAGGKWDPDRKGWKVPLANIGTMLKGRVTAAEWFAWLGSCS